MQRSRFDVLNEIKGQLHESGLEVTVDDDTVCVQREQWDEYSKQILSMASAAPHIKVGIKSFYAFIVEHYYANQLVKYTVKLCDNNKKAIWTWDLDTKRGPHMHDHADDKNLHLPYDGDILEIASHMLEIMREY